MASGVNAGCHRTSNREARRLRAAASACAALLFGLVALSPGARALEFLDGRIQLHGFAEIQVRALDERFSEELDLAQWYNVINLEFEFDIAPDGIGPIDLLSAYVRIEGRYDALYTQGFGLFPSLNTYGNHSTRLPTRLSDAVNPQYSGVLKVDEANPRIPDRMTVPLAPEIRGINFQPDLFPPQANYFLIPGEDYGTPFNGLFGASTGGDNVFGTFDDPAHYANSHYLDYKFAMQDMRGPETASTVLMGPWLPKNFIMENAVNKDRANPFRGRVSPQASINFITGNPDTGHIRYFQGDPFLPANYSSTLDPIDPRIAVMAFAPPTLLSTNGNQLSSFFPFANDPKPFGGDFSNIVPCIDPKSDDAPLQITGAIERGFCIPGSPATTAQNIRVIGGTLEAPFRPGPDLSNLDFFNPGNLFAQGLYYPSKGLQQELFRNSLNAHDFNINQTDRSFNRGASQTRGAKEVKEAYVDVEVLDSRLWIRLGLQNIVWGKTELFRTTDQFNPQDLALASLPSLEESRIALWSARFVYSLYDVGPLEDVRLEFAANIDKFQPADLGACGEAFTPDIVCSLTTGLWAHGALGVGVAGQDRPPDPWETIGGLEVGGRIEWRWDRFSFALADFYGYSDTPNVDAIFWYDRNVDVNTGRPLVAQLPGQAWQGGCVSAGGIGLDLVNGGVNYSTAAASHPISVTPGGLGARGGIGRDPFCLRPGGLPGGRNAYRFDTGTLLSTNALQNHHANQQIFSWICTNTIGVAATLDPGSCAWTIFSSSEPLSSQFLNFPFSEILTTVSAGEVNGQGVMNIFAAINNTQRPATAPLPPVPLKSLSRQFNDPDVLLNNALAIPTGAIIPGAPGDPVNCAVRRVDDRNGDCIVDGIAFRDRTGDGMITLADVGGYDGFDGRQASQRAGFPNFMTLDRGLTNEQRGLLGCGPFWGMRCDSSLAESIYGKFGGLDFMNMEASVLMQSWPGFEGTLPGYTVTSNAAAPGTVGFFGGPVCTRFVEYRGLVKLPGCRGLASVRVVQPADPNLAPVVLANFERGYLPSVDGCILGTRIRRADGSIAPVVVNNGNASTQLLEELSGCNNAITRRPTPERFIDVSGNPTIPNPACVNPIGIIGNPAQNVPNQRVCNAQNVTLEELPLIHPLAGCITSSINPNGLTGCRQWFARDLVEDFFNGSGQMFQNELAAVSWNMMTFLAVTSCDLASVDLDGKDHRGTDVDGAKGLKDDPECFFPGQPYDPQRCSFNSPYYCGNVKAFFSAAGPARNTVEAGGNGAYGRRTFLWHSGGEVALRYEKRNVLGFSTDFAEDVTKTNWGVEFTWIEGVPYTNNDDPSGVSKTDSLNLTVSVDRPTFINFLNPNRTFFFNSQWFFNYLPDYQKGFTSNGPWNVLFTFAVFTGYFQDRLLPQFVTVYDIQSQSGGLLPSFQYRFTESFSVALGMNYFWGRTQLKNMPVRSIGPTENRSGPAAYKDGADNLLNLIRKRDEVYMRLRWTF